MVRNNVTDTLNKVVLAAEGDLAAKKARNAVVSAVMSAEKSAKL